MNRLATLVMFAGMGLGLGLGGAWLAARPAVAEPMEEAKPATAAAATKADEPKAATASKPFKPATCDVFRVTAKLAETARFADRVTEKRDQLRSELDPLRKDLNELQEKARALGENPNPEDPQVRELFQQGMAKANDLRRKEREAAVALQTFVAQVSYEAYREVVASAEAMAEAKGYSHVFATQSIDEPNKPVDTEQFVRGMLSRPLVKFPQADDLTLDVMAELRVQ